MLKLESKIPKTSGVYKITNPNGRNYIGSSKNLYKRHRYYITTLAPKQKILNRSFLKYGLENHTFEILCYCEPEMRLSKEREYGLEYNALCEDGGLNIILPKSNEKPCIYSNILIEKFRKIGLARTYTKETIQKFSKSKKEHYLYNENHLSKPVIDLLTGVFYKSAKEAAFYNNIKRTTLLEHLNGHRKSSINLKYA